MTAFDIIVLFLLGGGAIMGFMRGFVQELLSLLSWILVVAAIRFLHEPVTDQLIDPIGSEAGAGVLAFLAVGIVTYALGKWISKSIGAKSRKSLLGPVDRVLGFGFGAIKGLIIATVGFLLIVMGYETIFGGAEKRPEWMTKSRTYALVNASGEAMSGFVADRRKLSEKVAERGEQNK